MAKRRETLDDLLLATGLTYSALADASGVARKTIFNARHGRTPRIDTIAKLARTMDVEPARLVAAIKAQPTKGDK